VFRAGGDAWIPGSYDPAANLIYWSTAQAKPWARISRGTDGDALFTNSVLALQPENGHIVWHHQLIRGESHDQDEVFESVLVNRGNRRSLFKMGKLGILWELDRTNGQYVAAHDLGYQNIVNLDSRTGTVTYRAEMLPKSGVPIDFCPGLAGLRNWRASAYHPDTQALYIPLSLGCQQSVFSEVEKVEGGGGNTIRPYAGEVTVRSYAHPASPGSRGRLIAMNINTGNVVWDHVSSRGPTSAALTTAGGLVFVADGQPSVKALDVRSGKVLFELPITIAGVGYPISFGVKGTQYLAIPSADTAPGISVFALSSASTGH
jgi:alcohol dehydrogenase (cytochrome c)